MAGQRIESLAGAPRTRVGGKAIKRLGRLKRHFLLNAVSGTDRRRLAAQLTIGTDLKGRGEHHHTHMEKNPHR